MITDTTTQLPRTNPLPRPWHSIRLSIKLSRTTFALSLIVLLAAILRLYDIQAVGNANEYYTAAVKSMLQSFHNFFFIAAEPGGSVTIDKPPLGLWIQAISALIFGVNGVAVVLPQVIAGILSVPLLFLLVKRYMGEVAGLIAALALAVTPVAIAVERNNTMDATLVLTLLLAAWAFIRGTDTGKLKYLILAGILVGLGFNIKMMQAFLPLPAFYALYFLGAKVGLKQKVAYLLVTTLVLAGVSFSWAAIVQLTPASDRPYIGSTQNNNVFELIFSYNGVDRLLGQGTGAAPDASGGQAAGTPNGNNQPPQGSTFQPSQAGQPPQGGNNSNNGGMFNTGTAGILRLLTAPLGNEVGWLLPFGLIGLGLLVFSTRIRFPLQANHQAAILFGGWLLTTATFFSVANFFHPYYLTMVATPLAAMVGIGVAQLWKIARSRLLLGGLLMVTIFAGTLAFQVFLAHQYLSNLWWTIPAVVVLIVGAFLIIARRNAARLATIGFACLVIAIMAIPTVWSAATNQNVGNALPEAYSGNSVSIGGGGPGQGSVDQTLLSYLEANTKDVEYLVAVQSSMQGTGYVLATGRPVLYMGGFNGGDPVVTATSLAQLVVEKKVRFVLEGGMGGGPGGNNGASSSVSSWVQTNCKVVTGISSTAITSTGTNNNFPPGMNQSQTLYECGVNS